MAKFDVCLIGNLIVDNIYCVSNFALGHSNKSLAHKKSIGSIANVLDSLIELEPNLNINVYSSIGKDKEAKNVSEWISEIQKNNKVEFDLSYSDNFCTSNALIISDISQRTRSSIVNWGACTEMKSFTAPNSKWFHVMYADKLHNLSYENLKILKQQGTVSVDFCLSNHSESELGRIHSLLPWVDYAIMSIDEAYSIAETKQASKAVKKIGTLVNKCAIIHSPHYVYICNGKELDILETNYIDQKNMNVLGAGDMFAAAVIAKKLEQTDTIKSAEFAHQYTTQKLMESYEKEI